LTALRWSRHPRQGLPGGSDIRSTVLVADNAAAPDAGDHHHRQGNAAPLLAKRIPPEMKNRHAWQPVAPTASNSRQARR
jgi:hypothetical protein